MPDVEPTSARPDEPAELPLVQLREVADGLSAIAPLVAGIESRLDGLPVEAQDVETELRRFLAVVDIGRLLFAQRAAELVAGYEAAESRRLAEASQGMPTAVAEPNDQWTRQERITAAELAACGLPPHAVGVAWTSFEECDMHAIDHAPGRAGVQPAAGGVVLFDADELDCSDCAGRQ